MGAGCSGGSAKVSAVYVSPPEKGGSPSVVRRKEIDDSDSDEEQVARTAPCTPSPERPAKLSEKTSPEKPDKLPTPPRASFLDAILACLEDPEKREEMLTQVCRSGDADVLQEVLVRATRGRRQLPNELLFDSTGNSLLHIAARHNQCEIIDLLLSFGCVDVDLPNAQTATPLAVGARHQHLAVVEKLLGAKANIDAHDRREQTPLLAAICSGRVRLPVLDALADAGGNVEDADEKGIQGLHAAVVQQKPEVVAWLLDRGAGPNPRTKQDSTPLLLASRNGNTEIVQLLLGGLADVTLSDPSGATPLHVAASLSVADALLKAGASVERVDEGGRNPLFFAVFAQDAQRVDRLVECSSRLDLLDDDGFTPLFRSLQGETTAIPRALIAAKADPNLHQKGGRIIPAHGLSSVPEEAEVGTAAEVVEDVRTPLQLAVLKDMGEEVQQLLDAKALPDLQPGSLGYTPLHLAVLSGNEPIARALLAAGARVNLPDESGTSAVELAQQRGLSWPWLKSESKSESKLPPIVPRSLPPIDTPANVDENAELEQFLAEWTERPANGVLDKVATPALRDATRSQSWRVRVKALEAIKAGLLERDAQAEELVEAAGALAAASADDKVQKVLTAALGVLEEVLSVSCVAELAEPTLLAALATHKTLDLVLEKCMGPTQVARHALDLYLFFVYSGRLSLDAVTQPLVDRLRDVVCPLAVNALTDKLADSADHRRLAQLLKIVGNVVDAFGLADSGSFRRAYVLPLLLLALQHPHQKVRTKALEATGEVVRLTGDVPEAAYRKLRPAVKQAVADVPRGPSAHNPEDQEDLPGLCMAKLPGLTAAVIQSCLEERASAAAGCDSSLREKLLSRDWHTREAAAAEMKQALQQEPVLPDANEGDCLWTTTDADEASQSAAWGGVTVHFFLEALSILAMDQVQNVFAAGVNLLTQFCDRVSRTGRADLARAVFPRLLVSCYAPLLAKMQDASSRSRRKATNALMYVASFEVEEAGAAGLLRQVTRGDAKKATLPRCQILVKLLSRPAVAESVSESGQRMALDFLATALEHRTGEVRQLAVQCLSELRPQWPAVEGLVAGLGSSQCKKLGLAPAKASKERTPPRERPETLPFAEPIADDAKEFVEPLLVLFGDSWTRCWYSPQWQSRVAALQSLFKKLDTDEEHDRPAELFDGYMRVLNEGFGDQVVKVFTEACTLLPLVLGKFLSLGPELLRAHLAPLLLHLINRTGDTSEKVRTKTMQTLFSIIGYAGATPATIGTKVLDCLAGTGASVGKVIVSVAGWMAKLSVLRDLVREHSLCSELPLADDWLPGLVPALKHQALAVRQAATMLCSQVYRRCNEDEDHTQEWLDGLPNSTQLKLKSLFVEENKENEQPARPQTAAFAIPQCLPAFARCPAADLEPIAGSVPLAAAQALKMLTGVLKAPPKGGDVPPELDVFVAVCEVCKHSIASDERVIFQAAAQLCVALLHHSQVSCLDVHVHIAAVFPPLLRQAGSSDHKIAMAADRTVMFLAKHPRVGAEAVARAVLNYIARTESGKALALLLRLVAEFGAYLCFQRQLVARMLETLAPLLQKPEKALHGQIADLVQRCQALQPRIVVSCLRDLDVKKRQAFNALPERSDALLLLDESPVKSTRSARYPADSEGWQTPELRTTASSLSSTSSWREEGGPAAGVLKRKRRRDTAPAAPLCKPGELPPLKHSGTMPPPAKPRRRSDARDQLRRCKSVQALGKPEVDGLDVLLDQAVERNLQTR